MAKVENHAAHAPTKWVPGSVPRYRPTTEGAPQLPNRPRNPHYREANALLTGLFLAVAGAGAVVLFDRFHQAPQPIESLDIYDPAMKDKWTGEIKLNLSISPYTGEEIEKEASEAQVLKGNVTRGIHEVNRTMVALEEGRKIAQAEVNEGRLFVYTVDDISLPADQQHTISVPLDSLDDASFISVLGAPWTPLTINFDNSGNTQVALDGTHGGVYVEAVNKNRQVITRPDGKPVYLRRDQVDLEVPGQIQNPTLALG